MSEKLLGILIAAFAFSATYGFLYVCQWLGRKLEQRGLTADVFVERRQAEWRSSVADPDRGGPGRATQSNQHRADEEV